MVPIEPIQHRHVEWRRRRSTFLIAVNVKLAVTVATVRQPVDEPRVSVKSKHDRFLCREKESKSSIGKTVRMDVLGLQGHEIDHVDDAHAHFRHVFAQEVGGRKRFQGRNVSRTRQHDVRLDVGIVARPRPNAEPFGTMRDRRIHIEPLRFAMLSRYDHVDVVLAAQAVIHDRKQRIGVWREVHSYDVRGLVHDDVEKTRILMCESVVVLPPHVRGDEIVQRRYRSPPRNLAANLEPLRMLIEHRIDDVHEGFVGVEDRVATGKQVALGPSLTGVFAQDLHDAAVGRNVIVVGNHECRRAALGDVENGVEPI